jgi:hypothetical protein
LIYDTTASGAEAIRSATPDNPADVMLFGPNRFFPAGGYDLNVRYRVEGVDAAPMKAIVRGVRRDVTLAEGVAAVDVGVERGAWTVMTLPFTLATDELLEARIVFGGGPPVAIDWISFTRR